MSQYQQVIDGAMQSGSRTITFSNGCVATTENFSFATDVSTAEDRTVAGAPQRTRLTAGWTEGTCTIQLPASITASARPKFGDTFAVTGATTDSNYSDFLFYVSKPVDYSEDNDPSSIRKAEISFRRCVSGSITTSGTW